MTSGGDAAGMNPAIKAAVDHARQLGMNPYVVYDGLEGLIDGKIKEATRELTNDMIYRGGTLLRSSRSKRFFDYEFRKQAYEHLKKRNIDKLIIMGGDFRHGAVAVSLCLPVFRPRLTTTLPARTTAWAWIRPRT